LDGEVALELFDPPSSHMQAAAPQFLNILRIGDVPDFLGLLAPNKLLLEGGSPTMIEKVAQAYAAAGASSQFSAVSVAPANPPE
jgi:hypothetical protein